MSEGTATPDKQEVSVNKALIVDKQRASGTPVIKENLQARGSEATKGLENGPDVIEHVSHAEVETLVKEIAVFYNCPQSAIEQGLKSEVYILNDRGFRKRVELHSTEMLKKIGVKEKGLVREDDDEAAIVIALGDTVEGWNKKTTEGNLILTSIIEEHANKTGGLCISQKEGSVIFVKDDPELDREEIKKHELLHAMSRRNNKTGDGFRSETGDYRNLDEAATQILTLSLKYPNLTVEELGSKVVGGGDKKRI